MGIHKNVKPRAVFLDRDGVINRAIVRDGKPYPPADAEHTNILPGVPEALARLKAAGYVLVVVSNQPDVARGKAERSVVEEINAKLARALPIDEFQMCFHDGPDGCACRKPRPGMLIDAAAKFDIDLPNSFMVGDRWRDVEAGRNAGCKTIFIDYRYNERQPEQCDYRVATLTDAAEIILKPATAP